MNFPWMRSATLAAAMAWLLVSCGGGVGSGGTGDVAGGYGRGTVTGFGSVIVDGERYDDSGARIEYDTEEGAPDVPGRGLERSDLAVGQRVELAFESDGDSSRARVFRISPALVGPVTSLSPLQVAGQTLRLNDDPDRGPVTRFGARAGGETLGTAQQLRLGDRLEVHGVQLSEGGAPALQATRIDRLPAAHGRWLRLNGVVSGLAADGRSFRLGALTVLLDERGNGNGNGNGNGRVALENGQRVQVWTREPIADNTVVADRVRLEKPRLAERQAVRLSGVAGACPGRDRSVYVCVGGTAVALAGAAFDAGLAAGSLDGRYLVVSGRFDAATDAVGEARLRLPPSR
ncbi:DUF5666 domain-containing protein [Caldimonas tepidiphila]|uniref:DUF5666 domain-containing protein n=1 Tax=Caldimonas tepidiphila TaxID=2315841 RepID=UPI000E5C200D|nr:DUF5666 domain-containing protein [Caldimonas tepidiphila]